MLNILGVKITEKDSKQVLQKIDDFLFDQKQHYIVTPNPEIILQTGKDEEFFYILNKADLQVADGFGLKIASWFMGRNIKRTTGADLLVDILKTAKEKKQKVFVLNWEKSLSQKEDIEKYIQNNYKELNFAVQDVYREIKQATKKLQEFKPDILITSFGAPYQEKFIYNNLKQIKSLKLAIGIGGGFDFLTKKVKRAPKWMRFLGLEWLWRFILEPKYRAKRIFNAIFVFAYEFFKWRFIHPFQYRPNVACLLYKQENGIMKVLILQRKDQEDHWQLPQGGTDGEDLQTAGSRELREEIGTDKFKEVAVFKNVYKYEFGEGTSKFGVKANSVMGYKGQKQGLFVAEFFGKDEDIKVNFWEHIDWKWVDIDDLVDSVHECRKEAVREFQLRIKN